MMAMLCKLTLFIALSVSLSLCKELAEDGVTKTPTIYFLHVNSEIKYRFSKTVITSKVVNPSSEASAEALFDVTLPDEAFLSAFKLIIDGTEYNGEVKEKEQAKQEYDVAKSRGQSAGHIVSKPRDSNKFQIQVNVAATEKLTFELTYRELLRRRTGNYEQTIFINPRQIVEDFRVNVSIEEYRSITNINVPPLRNDILTENMEGENKDANIVRLSATEVRVSYSLTASQQRALSEQGVSGQFVVQYDIEREKNSGEILVMDGYFVHFLAPGGLDPMPMDIVFVLDQSGSMSGNKIKQLHESMLKVLDEISEQDRFMLISFDDQLKFWRNELVQATSSAIADAKRFITSISARGSTDINLAMTEGLKVFSSDKDNSRAPVLVFLTDGQPTTGVTNTVKILENIKLFNEVQIPIFSLAFGQGADYDFTKKVAAQNNGLGKRIYEDSDAALQIAGFYQEISTVLMRNISFRYVDGSLNESTLTRTNFNTYFKGSELIVAGQIQDMKRLQDGVQVFAKGYKNVDIGLERPFVCVLPPPIPLPSVPAIHSEPSKSMKPTMMENLWAYLTIKQLLRKKDGIDDKKEIKNIDKKILAMSLKYQFVTPLTSMVVTLPDNSKAGLSSDTVEKPMESDSMGTFSSSIRQIDFAPSSDNIHAMPGLFAIGSFPIIRNHRADHIMKSRSKYKKNKSPKFQDSMGTFSSSIQQVDFVPSSDNIHAMPGMFAIGSVPCIRNNKTDRIRKSRRKPRRKSRRKKNKSPKIQGTQQLSAFFVNVSSVNMCFDLPLNKYKRYSIINMVQQKNGCSMSVEPLSLQIWTPKNTIPSLRVNKFRGRKLQETVVINSNQTVPQVECVADGIRLGVLSDERVRVTADISGRQRKQYTGILSRFINMKCKVVRRTPRNGKQVVKIKCRQRRKPTLKLKAIKRTAPSGESCLFLNKKMTNLLNLIPSNYEIIP